MGEELNRQFFSFTDLIDREDIVDIKIETNDLEQEIRINREKQGRDVNIDPGYITLVNVTLATTKDFRHRIYLGKGIFLENTLYYDRKAKSHRHWEWTFPDFRTDQYKAYFNNLREIYHKQMKNGD